MTTQTVVERSPISKPANKPVNKNKINLLLDIGMFFVFLLLFEVHATGETIHEWVGLFLGVVAIVHLLLHWNWIVSITKRFFQRVPGEARLNYILNVALFIAFVAILFSGIMISHAILPLIGLQASENHFWHWLHSFAADLSILIIGLHVALHWKWIVNAAHRYLALPFRRKEQDRQPSEAYTTESA